jgi:hypothetical protein
MHSTQFNRGVAEAEVRGALACPIDWGQVFQVEDRPYFHPLERLWERIVEAAAVDDEAEFFGPIFQLSELSDDELRALQFNVRTWRERANEDYLMRTRRFWSLRYAPREDYGKHLPPPGGRSPREIEALSARTGISKFYNDVPPEVMLAAFFHGLFFHFDQDAGAIDPEEPVWDQPLWDELMQNSECRVAFEAANLIGASDGQPTRFLCFQLNASIPILHGYPVSEQEANAIRRSYSVITIDDLRGWGRDERHL